MGIPKMDWTQVVLNGEEPCFNFHPESDDWFCGRAKRWKGHGDFVDASGTLTGHRFVSMGGWLTRLFQYYFERPEALLTQAEDAVKCRDIEIALLREQLNGLKSAVTVFLETESIIKAASATTQSACRYKAVADALAPYHMTGNDED